MANTMNNFYCNLPGGHYREQSKNKPKRRKLFKTIDELLNTEFTDINARELTASIYEANRLCAGALNFGYKTVEELQAAMERPIRMGEEAEAKILPLYRRLVEMGFHEDFLRE